MWKRNSARFEIEWIFFYQMVPRWGLSDNLAVAILAKGCCLFKYKKEANDGIHQEKKNQTLTYCARIIASCFMVSETFLSTM